MKFRVTMKDPDGVQDSLDQAAKDSLSAEALPGGLSERERAAVLELRRESIGDFAGKWLEYGEYAEIEFDTEAKTAVLVPK